MDVNKYSYIYTLWFLAVILIGNTCAESETDEQLGSLLKRFLQTERAIKKLDYKVHRQARLNANVNAIVRALFDQDAESDADIAVRDLLGDDHVLEDVIRELKRAKHDREIERVVSERGWTLGGETDAGNRAQSTTPAPPEIVPNTQPVPTDPPETPPWLLELLLEYLKNKKWSFGW